MQNDSVALQTAKALPYKDLAICIQALLLDHSVFVPPRLVQPLPNGGSLLAAQLLAPNKKGRALIVGTGVQAKAHLEAFSQGLACTSFIVAHRA